MKPGNWGRETGDRREVSLSLKCPANMIQASLVKQIPENVPSVPGSQKRHYTKAALAYQEKSMQLLEKPKAFQSRGGFFGLSCPFAPLLLLGGWIMGVS